MADAVTLTLTNQKNSQRNSQLHHHASGAKMCPVKCVARIGQHMMTVSSDPKMPICAFSRQGATWDTVRDKDITAAVRYAVAGCGLLERGFKLSQVGSHSLRAGGAMALKLNGIDETTIKKLGRWSGNTFMTYIHEQIGSVMAGASAKMVQRVPNFYNVGAV